MASKYNYQSSIDGTMDTTLGLIIRLNIYWQRADTFAQAGDYKNWNFVLDTIWRSLLFRDPLEIIYEDDNDEKIVDVKLSDDDIKLWTKLNLDVIESRKSFSKITSRQQYNSLMTKYYQALQMKDVGLRKFQHKLHLYVKEKSKNVSNAMWGG